jgi:predicted nuclease of predicted toxin-antitoxin system
VKFLVDAQLPPSLAVWLRDQGYEADHVLTIGMLDARDGDIWSRAVADDCIIVTKDRDFAGWAFSRRPRPQIVWLRCGNLPKRALFAHLATAWPRVSLRLKNGAAVVEVY